MKIVSAEISQLKTIKQLYKKAFPFFERKPFFILKSQYKKGFLQLFLAQKEGVFVGFVICIKHNGLCLIDYIAVSPQFRGCGYGGEILKLLKNEYKECIIFLEEEQPSLKAKNSKQRIIRKMFYLRHGFCETQVKCKVYGEDMELLAFGGDIKMQQYKQFMKSTLGVFSIFIPIKECKAK